MHASTQIHRTFLQLLYWFVTFFNNSFSPPFSDTLCCSYRVLYLHDLLLTSASGVLSSGVVALLLYVWFADGYFSSSSFWSWCCFLARHSMWVIIFETLLSLCLTTTSSPHTIALRYFLWFFVSIFVLHCLVLLLLSILQLAWFGSTIERCNEIMFYPPRIGFVFWGFVGGGN